jgi:hypothetical protein
VVSIRSLVLGIASLANARNPTQYRQTVLLALGIVGIAVRKATMRLKTKLAKLLIEFTRPAQQIQTIVLQATARLQICVLVETMQHLTGWHSKWTLLGLIGLVVVGTISGPP